MKKTTKILIYVITFIIAFSISAVVRMQLLGNAPIKLIKVQWDENVGTIYQNLDYENKHGNQYDLYIPTDIDKNKEQYLILYIHGGSFNSGSKEDGDTWCKFYASKGYITATVDYTLQNHGLEASLNLMNEEVENAVKAIKEQLENMGYYVAGMASCGVSAGGTLAMNLAYNNHSAIPVRFVFQLAAPAYFDPEEWGLLMKVNGIDTDSEFVKMMTGAEIKKDEYLKYIEEISPAAQIDENTVPTLMGYGLIDHCVPLNQKFYLMKAFEKYGVAYEYIEFPKSNHGMYNDLDKMQEFINKSLEYCERYFK